MLIEDFSASSNARALEPSTRPITIAIRVWLSRSVIISINGYPDAVTNTGLYGHYKGYKGFGIYRCLICLAIQKNISSDADEMLLGFYSVPSSYPFETHQALAIQFGAHRKTSTGWGFGGRDMISCNVSR